MKSLRSNNASANTHSQSQSSANTSSSASSSDAELETKLTKASSLEHKLSSTLSSSNNNNSQNSNADRIQKTASKIRIELCEIYSDILLSNPNFAYKNDIPNKLWRSCFYGRINENRSRISKEKNRYKKVLSKFGNPGLGDNAHVHTHSGEKNIIMEQEKRVKVAQEVLETFLKEAVVLYEYLVEQLQGMLIDYTDGNDGASDSDNDDEDDDESMNGTQEPKSKSKPTSTQTKETPKKIIFVIPTLFRIYIHLGDLHRYSSSYNSAEKAYLKASYLAPGKGNPYNQLAVCAQINDSTNGNGSSNGHNANVGSSGSHPLPAVALYWYCRSLLASHDAFVTSRSNLERLFMSNKKWIQESNIQTFADVAKKNSNSNGTNTSTGLGLENSRALKSLAKRKFLSHYVDFHGSLLSLLKNAGNSSSNSSSKEKKKESDRDSDALKGLICDLDNLVNEFSSVLEISAFGDAFLIKMVCINAFSVWNGMDCQKRALKKDKKNKSTSVPMEGIMNTFVITLIFVIRFATQLCSDVEKVLEKGIAKQQKQGKKTFGSIRLIGPIFLLCEFISNECKLNEMKDILSSRSDGNGGRNGKTSVLAENFDASVEEFWRGVAAVANIVNGNDALLQLIESQGDESINILPDDFQSLIRGYTPFLSLNSGSNSSSKEGQKVYLSPEEAVDALELYHSQSQTQTQQSQSSQRSRKSSSTHGGNDERTPEKIELEVKIKLKRFMKFIAKHFDSGELVKSHDGVIRSANDKVSMDIDENLNKDGVDVSMDVDENVFETTNLNETQDHTEEKDQDVLVYTTAESGKPALLIPGAFLLGGEEKEEEEEVQDLTAKDSSFISDAAMGCGLEENSTSLPNLLNPTSLFNKPSDVRQPVMEESKLLAVVNRKPPTNMPDLAVLPPMASIPPEPVVGPPPSKPMVRPPPGFNSMQKQPDIAALPMIPPGLRPFPDAASNPLPPPQVHGFSSDLSLPQTANPFVPLPPMQYNHGMPPNNGFPQQNENSFRSDVRSFPSFMSMNNNNNNNSTIGSSTISQQNNDDMNIDYDLFGLNSLGIFTDDRNDAEPNLPSDSLFQSALRMNNETQNPFAYD